MPGNKKNIPPPPHPTPTPKNKSAKEVWTAPLGPSEISAQWYAHARLAVVEMTAYVWGAGAPQGRWITFLTRVQEKPAELTLALLNDLCAQLDLLKTEWKVLLRIINCNMVCNTTGSRGLPRAKFLVSAPWWP